MTTGFDLDEIERLLAAATPGEWVTGCGFERNYLYGGGEHLACIGGRGDYEINDDGSPNEADNNAALIVVARNSLPAMIAEIRELRAENARLKGHWSALDKALADNIIETDQPHRVRWEGEWHYGPLADAYFAMTSVVRKLAHAALGEPQ